MPKDGAAFESLTAEIFEALRNDHNYESVEKNVLLSGPDGDREIDVLLKGKVGPFDCITIVECKDYNKNVDVTKIDALHSKMLDVGANKAVLVARKGFSKGAIMKAKRLNISLCTAHTASSEKWKFSLEVPFLVQEQSVEEIYPSFQLLFGSYSGEDLDLRYINEKPLHQVVGEYWNSQEFIEAGNECGMSLDERGKYFIKDRFGGKIEIYRLDIRVVLKNRYYFGYFNDLESSKLISYIDRGCADVIFDLGELSNYREKSVQYSSVDQVPKTEGLVSFTSKVIIEPRTNIKFKPSARHVIPIAEGADVF